MKIFTHFTRVRKEGDADKNGIVKCLSQSPKENLENILNEQVLYGGVYQSFFYNKTGYKEHLPHMISVTENRFHDSAIFIENKYSHGMVFAPGVIEATYAKPIIYQLPTELHELMAEKDKLSEKERIAWLMEEGYMLNVSCLRGRQFAGESEYRIKLFSELHHNDPIKGVGLQLPRKDIAILIVPEAETDYFETKYKLPAVPQEKIIYLANARKDKTEGVTHEFSEDDFFLFYYANSFLEKTNASYRWKKEGSNIIRF